MVEIKNLKNFHLDFINWLKSKNDIPNIQEYINYTTDKLSLYEEYNKTKDLRALRGLPRTLNRYRDEFDFDSESVKQACVYFDKMRKEIDKLS